MEIWREEARAKAAEFSQMNYEDFIENEIIVFIWSRNRAIETFIAILIFFLGSIGLLAIYLGMQYIREKPFAFLPMSMGAIFLFGGYYLFIAFIINTISNFKIRTAKRGINPLVKNEKIER